MNQMFNSMKSGRLLVCLLIFVTASSFVRAEEPAGDVSTEVMLARIRQVSSVRISPDGKLIAYTLSVPRSVYTDDDGPAWN